MSEYISREAAKNYVIGRYEDQLGFITMEDIIDQLDYVPAADVRPVVREKWIEHGRDRPPTCSNCGSGCLLNYESDYHKSDYCPHCGADMRKEIDHD